MKRTRKVLSLIIGIMCVFYSSGLVVSASEETTVVEGSHLIKGMETIGYTEFLTRGIYLMDGFSRLTKVGDGVIAVGGGTTARVIVDEITVTVQAQKLTGGKWVTIETWTEKREKAASVITSKTLEVEPGYYRVVCAHSANTDTSDSLTDGLYIS